MWTIEIFYFCLILVNSLMMFPINQRVLIGRNISRFKILLLSILKVFEPRGWRYQFTISSIIRVLILESSADLAFIRVRNMKYLISPQNILPEIWFTFWISSLSSSLVLSLISLIYLNIIHMLHFNWLPINWIMSENLTIIDILSMVVNH